MVICGVICEYNPFHNGHAYHLQALRVQTGCDYIVCAMSGPFTQRGEAAILSKWQRAEMALRCGADAVFELPTLFALRDANRFALGGVSLLTSLGAVTHLGFGSESGDLATLAADAGKILPFAALRPGLQKGMTLARARGEVQGIAPGAPNDALAMEYLRAIRQLDSPLIPVTIRREGHGYHDPTLGPMASATAIRKAIYQGEDVRDAMPAPAHALLMGLQKAGLVQGEEGLTSPLLYALRTMDEAALSQAADCGEGLEHRILRAAQEGASREELLSRIKCKRYTHARLSRILTQAMVGLTKPLAGSHPLPTYARLLGFRGEAQPLLRTIKERAAIPIVTRAAKFRQEGDPAFALDIRAGDIWSLGLMNEAGRKGHMDLWEKVVILD